jgi:hypothetical protein
MSSTLLARPRRPLLYAAGIGTALLVEAVKAQQKQLGDKQAQLDSQQQISALKSELDALKAGR